MDANQLHPGLDVLLRLGNIVGHEVALLLVQVGNALGLGRWLAGGQIDGSKCPAEKDLGPVRGPLVVALFRGRILVPAVS